MDADMDSPVSSTKSDSDANTSVSGRASSIRKKDAPSQILSNRRKSDMEISQASNSGEDSPLEGSSVVHTKLPPGKVTSAKLLFASLSLSLSFVSHRQRGRPRRWCDEGKRPPALEGLRVLSTGPRSPWSVHNCRRARSRRGSNNRCSPTFRTRTVTTAPPNESTVDNLLINEVTPLTNSLPTS